VNARDLEICGGRIVTPDGVIEGDLIVRDGRIAEISSSAGGPRPESFDARGCFVLPGGVDPHTHALTDLPAVTRSAAHGGTTTVQTFTLPHPGEGPVAAFERARAMCSVDLMVDVAVHGSYFDPSGVSPDLLDELCELGACGAQVFLAFPELGLMFLDDQLYRFLRDAAPLGLPVQVQCENGPLVDAITDELIAAGATTPRDYPRARPGAVEDEAVARTIAIAALAGAPVYLVHLSTEIALATARAAKARGVAVTVEVCTHHLLLDDSVYERPDAARFIVGPPLRRASDVDALWVAIADGTVDTVGSDHSHLADPLAHEQASFLDAAMGLPGIELRMPLVLSEGLRREVPMTRLVEVLAAGPARAFGLYPRKGALAVGSDADIIVWDPRGGGTVTAEDLHDGLGHTPYESVRFDGRVRLTVVGGRVAVLDGEVTGDAGGGRFVAPVDADRRLAAQRLRSD
jgi:dihydropyrimidinase